jgi:hypothetical protein
MRIGGTCFAIFRLGADHEGLPASLKRFISHVEVAGPNDQTWGFALRLVSSQWLL